MKKKRKIGEILLELQKININQLEEALNIQKKSYKKIGEIFVEHHMADACDIVLAVSIQAHVKVADLRNTEFEPKVFEMFNSDICRKYNMLPLGFKKNKIKVAFSDPFSRAALSCASMSTGCEIEQYVSTEREIKKFITIYYDNNISSRPPEIILDEIINKAIEMKASDIHIEPYQKEIWIRFRIDGELIDITRLPVLYKSIISRRIKVLSKLNITETRLPQDGKIFWTFRNGNAVTEVRVSIVPSIHGEKIVLRILNMFNPGFKSEDLGFSKENLKKIRKIINSEYGIMLITGPTGSGKSTTLYTVLEALNKKNKSILTIEDPVEHSINGVTQIEVKPEIGYTFEKGLKSILRQDPDIIMIGEMRDNETAHTAVRAAITGHFVLSTLHTDNTASSPLRLLNMGVEAYMIAASLKGVVAQRLIKKLCCECKEKYIPDETEKKKLKINKNPVYKDIKIYRAKGCPKCNYTGYRGRTGVYEVMEVTDEIREKLLDIEEYKNIRKLFKASKISTLEEEACKKVLQGITDIEEIEKFIHS